MKKSLTRIEQKYLDLLVSATKPVHIDSFLQCHGGTVHSGANLVAQHIKNLRNKVRHTYTIEAVYGHGYQMFAV